MNADRGVSRKTCPTKMPDEDPLYGTLLASCVTGILIGYARVSTDEQDLTAQRDALAALGVASGRIYVDHGLTGTTRERPGLGEALAACRDGDTLVVTKLDRLARSLPDARDIVDSSPPARSS
jgi:predicted site-specific integrase-resolvase